VIVRPVPVTDPSRETSSGAGQKQLLDRSGNLGGDASAESGLEDAWSAVARMERVVSDRYLLISQPDHARLSGDLAAQLRADFLPAIDAAMTRAIGVHDDGWAQFEFESDQRIEPQVNEDGRPQNFMEFPPRVFLGAWEGSIVAACRVSDLGGLMVSGHFFRLGKGRMQAQCDTAEDAEKLREFLAREEERQSTLEKKLKISPQEISDYVDLLQFCDLLSLYLCCGANSAVEFPQCFAGKKIRIHAAENGFAITPSLFTPDGSSPAKPLRFTVPARPFPSSDVDQDNLNFSVM
jgi:hypothetical protein